jgi:hypothetical protein
MENGTFIDDFPIKTSIYEGFSMAMLNNQMVTVPAKRWVSCKCSDLNFPNHPVLNLPIAVFPDNTADLGEVMQDVA